MHSIKFKLKGFTLIELLVVMSIIGFLLAIVPPMLPNVIGGTQLKAATRDLNSALKYARSKAISSQGEVTLKLNVKDKTYSIQKKKKQLSLPKDSEIVLTTAKSEQLSKNEGAIRFFADGSSTGGGIAIKRDKAEYFIDVNWLTGKVKILP